MFSRSTRGGSLPSWTLRSSLLSFFPLLLFCTFSLICCFSVLSSSRRRWTLPRFTFSFCQDGPTKLSRKGLSLSFRLLSLTLAPSLSLFSAVLSDRVRSVSGEAAPNVARADEEFSIKVMSVQICPTTSAGLVLWRTSRHNGLFLLCLKQPLKLFF